MTYPMKLVPRLVEKPWGGRRIRDLFGKGPRADRPIGESWEFFDRPDGSSTIANGPLAGRTIASLRGERPVPLLLKIIDAREDLSVQVHPDEEAAEELAGEAKTEAWYVIEARDGARITKGLRDGVDAPRFIRAAREGRAEECLHRFTPSPGDVVFLPGGTVHSIGAGVVLFEVQQNSDTTYRLHDWNRPGLDGRPRELHLEEALRATDFSGRGLDRVEPRLLADDGVHRRVERVSCPAFVLEEHVVLGLCTYEKAPGHEDSFQVLFVLGGEGTIRPFRRSVEETFFTRGDTLLLPAEYESFELHPRPGRTLRFLSVHAPGGAR